MATLTLNQVRKSFGSLEVLHGVDLSLEDGGFLVLLGPSGCGKSTLLSIIAGLEPLSGGEVQIGNRVVNDVHPKDRNIAMVFQSYALYPTMSVARNIGFGLEMRKIGRAEREQAIQKVAALLQVDHLLERKPGQLSGGQRQRVAMGRAIVRNPDLFLFDEPLSNLDAKLRVEMRTEIKRLHDRLGTTIVYVTHDQVEAMTLGTKVAVMKDGLIQQFDEPQAIYDNPANMFVAGFIGSPPMNFLPGRLEQGPGKLSLHLEGNGAQSLQIAEAPDGVNAWTGRPIIAGIRPEAIHPATEGQADLIGVVDVVEPTGPDTMVVVKVGEKSLTARLSPRIRPKPGEPLPLRLEQGALRFFDPATGNAIG